MKILSYKVKGNVILYNTDEGEFAYPVDKFSSVSELETEIMRKVLWLDKNKLKNKKIKILASLKENNIVEKVDDVILV